MVLERNVIKRGICPTAMLSYNFSPNRGSMAFETMFFFGGAYIQSYFTSVSLRGTMAVSLLGLLPASYS